MKKYLMMALAAVALASCTKHDIEYVNPDVAKYEQVFTERFGTPSSTHTWGFGSGITRSAYPNANQWASQGYNVPDPLLAGQMIISVRLTSSCSRCMTDVQILLPIIVSWDIRHLLILQRNTKQQIINL